MASNKINHVIAIVLMLTLTYLLFFFQSFPFSRLTGILIILIGTYNYYKFIKKEIESTLLFAYLITLIIGVFYAYIITGGIQLNNAIIFMASTLVYIIFLRIFKYKHTYKKIFTEILLLSTILLSTYFIIASVILVYVTQQENKKAINKKFQQIKPTTSILEVNCGRGDLLLSLKQNHNCDVVGVDNSSSNIEFAQVEYNLKVFHKRILTRIVKNFDTIINFDIKNNKELNNYIRLLKPDGTILIGNKDISIIEEIESFLKEKNIDYLSKSELTFQPASLESNYDKIFQELNLQKKEHKTEKINYLLVKVDKSTIYS